MNLISLAGFGQMRFSFQGGSHLFSQKCTELGTFSGIDSNILTPVGCMVFVITSDSTCHTRHQPRVTMLGGITFIGKDTVLSCRCQEGIINTWKCMPNGRASTKGLNSQNVIQMKTFVTRNCSCFSRNGSCRSVEQMEGRLRVRLGSGSIGTDGTKNYTKSINWLSTSLAATPFQQHAIVTGNASKEKRILHRARRVSRSFSFFFPSCIYVSL